MATVEEIQTEITELKAARTAILTGAQEYSNLSGSLRRPDLKTINQMIKDAETRLTIAQGGGALSHSTIVFGTR